MTSVQYYTEGCEVAIAINQSSYKLILIYHSRSIQLFDMLMHRDKFVAIYVAKHESTLHFTVYGCE